MVDWRRVALPLGVAAGVVALAFLLSPYHQGLASLAIMYGIAAVAQTVLMGTANQPSMGNAAFLAIAAYATGMLTSVQHWPFWGAGLAGAAVAALVGWLVGVPVLRFRGLYLAVASIAFLFAVQEVLTQWSTAEGVATMPVVRPAWLASDRSLYVLSAAVAAVVTVLVRNLLRSRTGRALRVLRESEVAAEAAGIRIGHYKALAFSLAGAVTGLAGALLAAYSQGVTPSGFGLTLSISLVAMAVIGGLGSLAGAYAGAVVITLLPYLLDSAPGHLGSFDVHAAAPLVSSILLLLALIFVPRGLHELAVRIVRMSVRRARASGQDARTVNDPVKPET